MGSYWHFAVDALPQTGVVPRTLVALVLLGTCAVAAALIIAFKRR